MKIIVNDINALPEAAAEFSKAIGSRRHLAFHAPMGAGKTTFISALCRFLGSLDDVTSPTFSIVNEYLDGEGDLIYHFDFYRIETPEETLDLGLDDYFDSGSLCLMEWPENVEFALPEDTLDVYIDVDDADRRIISFYD